MGTINYKRRIHCIQVHGFAFLLALSATATATAQVGDVELGAILGAPKGNAAPGCVMAVYRDGGMQHLVGHAVADLSTGARVDGDTQFYAASISKQFTALAVVQLHLAGKLDLDGDIRKLIQELPEYEAKVTPRMLLQHQSGILDSLSLVTLVYGPGNAGNVGRDRTLALVKSQPDTNFTPGTRTSYSNGGYLLLSELVQRASGMKFADYVHARILKPLGMHDSYVLDGEPRPSGKRARGYVKSDSGWELKDTFPRYGGSGGLMLTLNDLSRYEHDIVEGHRVWTPEVRAIMEAPGVLASGGPAVAEDREDGLAYAMGLQVGERAGRRVVEHGGSADAFQHMYTRIPDRELAVATICNIGNSSAKGKTLSAIAMLLGPSSGDDTGQAIPAGVYRSPTLPVRYVVSHAGNDAVDVAGIPDGAAAPGFQARLQRSPDDNAYRGGGLVLRSVADEPGVLMIGTARAGALRAYRVGHGKEED